MCGQLLRDKRCFDSYTRVGKTEYATARSTWTNTSGSTLFQTKSQGKGKNDVPMTCPIIVVFLALFTSKQLIFLLYSPLTSLKHYYY